MPVPTPTVDEFIATFNRSALPVVAVEGDTDERILRNLEERVGIKGVIVSVGGRTPLFELISRLEEIENQSVVFLADQDLFCLEGSHLMHERLVYTWGYSIENDVISGSRIDRLIWPIERAHFQQLREMAVAFFAREYDESRRDRRPLIWNVSLPSIIDPAAMTYRSTVKHPENLAGYQSPFCRRLRRYTSKILRGKQLLQLYMFILNKPGRPSRYSSSALLESCASMGPNRRLTSLGNHLRLKIEACGYSPSEG